MFRCYLTLICLFGFGMLNAQLNCGFEQAYEESDGDWIDRALILSDMSESRVEVTLPVIFHVIKDGTQGEVNDAEVLATLDQLNDAFRNINYYNPATGADTEINFCLAQQDESGLPTTGITRTDSRFTTMTIETEDSAIKSLIHWDATCYINIYIVFEIISSAVGGGVQGYANFPSGHGGPTDGIVVEARLMNGSPISAAVLIHEMGHFLGLYHTFRGGCANSDCINQGDRICDTPPDNSTAPSDCADPLNSCDTDAQSGLPADVPDMVTNYMDYGYLDCRNDFSQGQADRMQLAIMMERMSLLDCPSCEDPCNNPFSVLIDNATGTIGVNQTVSLSVSGAPAGATVNWYSNGVLIGTGNPLTTTFSPEGKVDILVEVIGADPTCVAYDSWCVEIVCPVRLNTNAQDTACLVPGSTLSFTAMELGANAPIEWWIDGVLEQTGGNFNWTVPALGRFELQVRAPGSDCDAVSQIFFLFVNCRETCDNGIDDDGDGLVDGFDPDCCDTINQFYFDPCYEQCPYEIKDAFTTISRKWTSSGFRWSEANTPLIGDVDSDGDIEIVGLSAENLSMTQIVSGNFLIVDATTGVVQSEADPGRWISFSKNISMADVDRDGLVEIFHNGGSTVRFDLMPNGDLTRTWTGAGGGFSQPTITDFDEDGEAEVLLDNGILDAATGRTLVAINTGINEGSITYIAGNGGSAAVDVLPTNACAFCQGKELIVGNEVYSVNINKAGVSEINLEQRWPGGDDGYTSIVDFDLDGDLDAVVVRTVPQPDFRSDRHVVVWDLQTPTALTTEFVWNNMLDRVAHPAVGDVTGDGKPEIVIADYSRLKCLTHDGTSWTQLFDIANDDRSGMSGPSLFDFDADGRLEVVHRDQSTIRIIEGSTGRVLFSDPCTSGTGYDVPTVADIDGDREAELICSCAENIVVYEPDPGTWALTRPVWNQLLYYAVNVNDDLTLPIQQQQHHLPGQFDEVNFYMAQYGTKEYQASDLYANVLDKKCEGDNVRYLLEICNLGPATFNDTLRLRGYDANPLLNAASVVAQRDTFISVLFPDSCFSIEVVFDRTIDEVWWVLNDDAGSVSPFSWDDDFPNTGIDECDFTNNLIRLTGFPELSPPDLGPDSSMCDFGIVELDAGAGYSSYRWHDGTGEQTWTAFSPGKYWVTVQDSCGKEYSDTMVITIDSSTVIDLGPDREVCAGDTLVFSLAGYGDIVWGPSPEVDCDGCEELRIAVDSTLVLTGRVMTSNGCFGFDSVRITVSGSSLERDSITICQGDSVQIGSNWYKGGDEVIDTIGGSAECDSLVITTIFEETVDLDLGADFQICAGDSVIFDLSQYDSVSWVANSVIACLDCPIIEVELNTSDVFEVMVYSENGCVATDQISVQVRDTIVFMDTLGLCEGDSIFLFDQWISDTGLYEQVISLPGSCDTLQSFRINLISEGDLDLIDIDICEGDTIGLRVNVMNIDRVRWNSTASLSCDTCALVQLYPTTTELFVVEITTNADCVLRDSFLITVAPKPIKLDTMLICGPGDSVFFDGQWISEEGEYEGEVTGFPCDTVVMLTIERKSGLNLSLPDTVKVELGKPFELIVQGDSTGIDQFGWRSGIVLNCLDCYDNGGMGTVSGEVQFLFTDDEGCEQILVTYVEVQKAIKKIFIPNIFSPNGDNLNDVIGIFTNDPGAVLDKVEIYDRWGELVFQQKEVNVEDWQGWDGTFNGELLNPGVLVLVVSGAFSDGEQFSLVRGITLVY